MDFKSLLQSMDNISETVHKAGPGGYGNRHGSETQTDQYGKPIGKVSLASLAPKDDTPKSRGRPVDPNKPKTGKDDPKNQKVGDIFGRTTGDVPKGKKGSQHTPMKDADKEEKKAEKKSLKDWIEASEQNVLNEEGQITVKPMPGASQIIGPNGEPMGTADAQTANVIKDASNKGTLNLGINSELDEEEEEEDGFDLGDAAVGGAAGYALGSGALDGIGAALGSLVGLEEKFDKPVTTDPSEKGKYKGKSKSELLKAYNHLKKTGPHKKGSKQFENMKELAFAIRAKSDWGKVQEEQVEEGGYNPDRDAQQEWNRYAQGDRDFQNQERNAGEEDDAPRYPRTSDRMRQAKQRHYGFKPPRSESIGEGEGNFEKALDKLSGSWSGWYKDESSDPNIEKYFFDDGEGGYDASGTIEHNLQTGQVYVNYRGDEYHGPDVEGTFDNFGEAMRALRGGGGSHGGKAPNFDRLGDREPYTSDDLYKSDRVGRKGSLSGGASNKLKQSIQFNKGRLGPKGVLPEQDELDVKKPFGKLTKADFAALRNKKKVKESISFNEMMDDTHSDMQDMLQELQQDIDHFNATGHCSDKLEAFLKVHGHNKRKITDEGEFTQHYMDANKPSPVRQNAEIAKAPQQHTPWSVDPINAATDRAGSFLKNLGQPKKTFESTNMKDIQLESWEKELNSLLNLNEGITVSSSTGQQGSPDSVSVNATDGDAQQLLQVLRSAGVGVFGGEQEHSDYGAPMNSQEPTGAGSEPEMSPAVVGDGDDMMTLIKKMSGIQDSGEPEGTASSDYESEEGSDDNQVQHGSNRHDNEENKDEIDEFLDLSVAAGNATGGGAQGGTSGVQGVSSTGGTSGASNQATGGTSSATNKNSSDVSTSTTSAAAAGRGNTAGNSLEEENMEEGNKYLYNVLKAKEAGKKQADLDGDGNLEQVKEGSSCNECGMYEARCVCEPGKEQVEEEYANEAGHEEMAQLKHLLSMGNDMHKEKRSQAVGNPQQVTFETTLLKDSTSLLQDFKKLSGIK